MRLFLLPRSPPSVVHHQPKPRSLLHRFFPHHSTLQLPPTRLSLLQPLPVLFIVWLVLPAIAPHRDRLAGDRCIGGRLSEALQIVNFKTLPGATFDRSLCMLIIQAGLFRGLATSKGRIEEYLS